MITHTQKDLITGKSWNSKTGKWVKRLRETAKGKAKGSTYDRKLNIIKQTNPNSYRSFGWLPIQVDINDLVADAAQYWNYTHPFDIDKAVAVFTLIIVKRCKLAELKKQNYYFGEGYVGIHSDDFRKWVDHHKYPDYLQFLEDRVYIRTFRTALDTKSFIHGQMPCMYKIADYRLKKDGDARMFYKVPYTTSKMLVKVFSYKQNYKLTLLQQQVRTELVENVYKITEQLASDAFTTWALSNPKKFKTKKKNGLEEANRMVVTVEQMKQGIFTINPCDDYSGRFHSPFTYRRRCVRNFIRIDGEPAIEIDIKNSQFFLFSLLRSHSNEVKPILKGLTAANPGKDNLSLEKTLSLIQDFYDRYEDVRTFLDASADNSIYQVMMCQYSKKKKFVKDLCFKALFSAEEQCVKSKEKLMWFYPNVVELCETINTHGRYTLPKILQTLESRIYLDMVALEAIQQGAAPFITVHDAFYVKPCDTSLFTYLIEDTFAKLCLPSPKVEVK
ncbi:hypothetical protein I0P70_02700 [Pontibacter sp. FD36]|uniref:hypothetical protein n=1 Tax=Pontibacter sp. FD36 TaxID=2789860 RepID=UPI0018AC6D17|nr:hypothetical protein [Pontibacter sp. FD36]MBF8962143.1 hypothetical protein [Pontibacter sp. FD36]